MTTDGWHDFCDYPDSRLFKCVLGTNSEEMKTLIYTLVLVLLNPKFFLLFLPALLPSSAILLPKNNTCNGFTYPRYEDRIYAKLQHETGRFIEDWTPEDDREFMMRLINDPRKPGGCDFKERLTCGIWNNATVACNNTCGICECNRYTSSVDNNGICQPIVGYPCRFRVNDTQGLLALVKGNKNCVGNASCDDIYDNLRDNFVSEEDVVDRIKRATSNGVIWDKPLVGILPPMHRYFLKNVVAVCACMKGFNTSGFGQCAKLAKP